MKSERKSDAKLYRFLRPIVKFLTVVFLHPKFVGLENIPKEGKVILAGTHTSNLDCLVLMSSTKRSVHFMAKIELFRGPLKILFANMGLIPVNREAKNHEAIVKASEYLNDGNIVGIFPEGTTQKGRGLLPFKIGAVKLAKDTGASIVPFVISGKYNPFKNKLKIIYGKPFTVTSDDLDKENEDFRNKIISMSKEI